MCINFCLLTKQVVMIKMQLIVAVLSFIMVGYGSLTFVSAALAAAAPAAADGPAEATKAKPEYDNSWCFKGVYDYDNCPG